MKWIMGKTSISNLLKDFQIKSLTGVFLDLNSWNSENYFIVLVQKSWFWSSSGCHYFSDNQKVSIFAIF